MQWAAYMELERSHLRKDALEALDGFISEIESEPEHVRRDWVDAVCRIMFEHPESTFVDTFNSPVSRIIIRQPLLEAVILPVLTSAYQRQGLPYGRWIFQLRRTDILVESPTEGPEDPLDFLRGLLSSRSDDKRTAALLIRELHWAIEQISDRFDESERRNNRRHRRLILEFLELVVKYGQRETWADPVARYTAFLDGDGAR